MAASENFTVEVRGTTRRLPMRVSSVRISSWMPSCEVAVLACRAAILERQHRDGPVGDRRRALPRHPHGHRDQNQRTGHHRRQRPAAPRRRGRRSARDRHRGHEPIAATRFIDQEAGLPGRFAQRLADRPDVLVEVVLLDDGVRPDRLHQAVLVQQFARMAREVQQQLERARRQRHARAVGREQHALLRIDAEFADFEHLRFLRRFHRGPFRRIQAFSGPAQRRRGRHRPPSGATSAPISLPQRVKPMNTTLSSARLPRPRRSIYIPLAVLAGVIAIAGFWRTYFGALFAGRSHAEWLVHLHAAVFMGWIVLVGLQSYFAMRGRIELHRKLGRIGMAYGAVLVVVGLTFATIMFARRVAVVGPDGMKGGSWCHSPTCCSSLPSWRAPGSRAGGPNFTAASSCWPPIPSWWRPWAGHRVDQFCRRPRRDPLPDRLAVPAVDRDVVRRHQAPHGSRRVRVRRRGPDRPALSPAPARD
jgi:hypothetical protein